MDTDTEKMHEFLKIYTEISRIHSITILRY